MNHRNHHLSASARASGPDSNAFPALARPDARLRSALCVAFPTKGVCYA